MPGPRVLFAFIAQGFTAGVVTAAVFGGFVAALLAIPTAGALQVLVKEVWQATAPGESLEPPAPAAEPADEGASGSCPRDVGGSVLVHQCRPGDEVAPAEGGIR